MKIAGSSLFSARVFNLIVGILGLVGFLQLARRVSPRSPLLAVAFLAFQPYYLRNCAVFYMGNYGLAAAIWALTFYLGEKTTRNTLLTGVFLGVATLCSQWTLAITAGVLLAEAVQLFGPGWNTTAARGRQFLSNALMIAVFQVPAVAVFIGWGGLTHPNFSSYALEMSAQHTTGTLAVLGFAFAFWLLGQVRSMSPRVVAIIVTLSPIFLLSLPDVGVYQGGDRFTGLTVRILEGMSARLGFDTPVMIFPAATLGLALLYLLFRSGRDALLAVRFSALLLIVTYAVSVIVGETHVALCLPLIFLLVWVERGRDLWLRLAVAQNGILGLAYTLYFTLVKPA